MDGKTLFLMAVCTTAVFAIAGGFFVESLEPRPFEITFLDWDGSVVHVGEYAEGDPIDPPADPSRPSDERKDYAFAGWSPPIPESAGGETAFLALYSESDRLYGVSASSANPGHGGVAVPGGPFPYGSKVLVSALPGEGHHFVSWTENGLETGYGPEFTATVTGDVEFLAFFAVTPKPVTVTPVAGQWKTHGEDDPPIEYTSSGLADGDAFTGALSREIGEGVGDYAITLGTLDAGPRYALTLADGVFSILPVPFKVTFLDWDGGIISTHEYQEGDAVGPPEDPSRPSDERYDYAFAGWDPGIPGSVDGDGTFTATYSRSERLYRVSVSSGDPDYGTTASFDGRMPYGLTVDVSAVPERGCHFVSWTLNGGETDHGAECSITVTGDIELVASFAITHDATFSVSTESEYNVFPATVLAVAEENPFAVKREWRVLDVFGEHHGMSDPVLVSERVDGVNPRHMYAFSLDSALCVEVTHSVTYSDGHAETATEMHIVDGEYYREFAWYDLDNELRTMTLEGLSYSNYATAKYDNMSKSRSERDSDFFFVEHNAHISKLADRLKEYTVGFTELQKAQFLMNFVRFSTWYDYYEAEHTEFRRTAEETMFEATGDCEDAAFYYAALAREFGLEFIIISMLCTMDGKTYGHADIAVNVPCESGHYVEFDGKRYFYANVTSIGQYFHLYDPGRHGYMTIGTLPGGYEITRIYSVYSWDLKYESGLKLVPVPLEP